MRLSECVFDLIAKGRETAKLAESSHERSVFWAVFANFVSCIAIEKKEYVYAPPYVKRTYSPFLYLFLLFQKLKCQLFGML